MSGFASAGGCRKEAWLGMAPVGAGFAWLRVPDVGRLWARRPIEGRRAAAGRLAPERRSPLGVFLRVDELPVAGDVAVLAADDEHDQVVVADVRNLPGRRRL